MLTIKGTL